MEDSYFIIAITFISIIYLIATLILIKKKNSREISMRSPNLLHLNNLGGYLMILTYLIYDFTDINNGISEKFCYILPYNYVLFHFLMIISFIFRYQRLTISLNITDDQNKSNLKRKRFMFTERFYLKLLLVTMLILIALVYFINFVISKRNSTILIVPFHFEKCFKNYPKLDKFNEFSIYFWTILNLIECSILITYIYLIQHINIKLSVKIELYIFFFSWFCNTNFLRILDFSGYTPAINNIKVNILVFELFILTCFFVNTCLPLIYAFQKPRDVSLHFTSNLLNNLFLFLTNEFCFKEIFHYLNSLNDKLALEYLVFYIRVISLKLRLNLNEFNENYTSDEVQKIYEEFFFQKNLFPSSIIAKAKEDVNDQKLDISLFNESLCYVYEKLEARFESFKKSDSYLFLVSKITLNSDLFCRMYNTGLIYKP